MEIIGDDYMKVFTPLGAKALILVDFSYIGRSTADPFPRPLGNFWTNCVILKSRRILKSLYCVT